MNERQNSYLQELNDKSPIFKATLVNLRTPCPPDVQRLLAVTLSLIVLNNTKVIPARLIFWKDSGARIEIFLLDPLGPTLVMEAIMNVKKSCRWHCIIGNAKKWKIKTSLSIKIKGGLITAERAKENEVVFSWNHDLTWSELLNELGNLPLCKQRRCYAY